jgi:hypothetical protein
LLLLANSAPTANPDSAEVAQNRAVPDTDHSVLIPVLANDTDPDGDPLNIAAVVAGPAHGTATISGGSIRYVPADGYVGPDSFTYTATDGEFSSNVATVSIEVYRVMCSGETVTTEAGDVNGSFTRLTDNEGCKRYELAAFDGSPGTASILFQPDGGADVDYRGFVSFGPTPAPSGPLTLQLTYDQTGGNTFVPVPWCNDPEFSGGLVTGAQIPTGHTWCIAGEQTQAAGGGNIVTTWQVFGHDDPRFK